MSKYGNLTRGALREDGFIFWSYDSAGRECWCAPDVFDKRRKTENDRSLAYAAAHKREAVEATREWRRKNPKRFEEQRKQQEWRVNASRKLAMEKRQLQSLIDDIEKADVVRCEANGDFVKNHIKVFMTERRRGLLLGLLRRITDADMVLSVKSP